MVTALLMNIISGIPCIQPRPVKKLTTQLYSFSIPSDCMA